MKTTRLKTICLGLCTLAVLGGVFFWQISQRQQQTVLIDNLNKTDYSIAYYASANGRWIDANNYVHHDETKRATFSSRNLMTPAYYQIAVGDTALRKAYCTANIEQPILGRHPIFVNHQGNCHTQTAITGQLTLVVGHQL